MQTTDFTLGQLYGLFSRIENLEQEVERLRRNVPSGTTPTMLTIQEVADRSDRPYEYVRQLCLNGKIAYKKSGRKYLINYEKYIEYLNAGEQEES